MIYVSHYIYWCSIRDHRHRLLLTAPFCVLYINSNLQLRPQHVAVDPSRESAGYVNLQAPRTSYGPCGGRVARREKRELDRPRIVQNSGHVYPILRRTRADFFPIYRNHRRPCTKSGLLWGAPCRSSSGTAPRVGLFERSPAPKNAPRGSGRTYAAPHKSGSGRKGGWLCEG